MLDYKCLIFQGKNFPLLHTNEFQFFRSCTPVEHQEYGIFIFLIFAQTFSKNVEIEILHCGKKYIFWFFSRQKYKTNNQERNISWKMRLLWSSWEIKQAEIKHISKLLSGHENNDKNRILPTSYPLGLNLHMHIQMYAILQY